MDSHGARKGQASLEQLIIAAIGITMIAIVFYYSMTFLNDSIRASQAQDMVEKLSKSADYVYSLGPGSKDVVDVYVPEGIIFTDITNNTVWVRLGLSSGESDVFADTKPVVIGEIPLVPGHHKIPVYHTQTGKVMLGDASIYCSPFTITRSFIQGENGTATINLKNIGDYGLENITSLMTGTIQQIASYTPSASKLNPLETDIILLNFIVPESQQVGSYSGTVTVTADILGNNTGTTECSTFITAFVLSSKPPDDTGPIIVSLSNRPKNPSTYTRITIEATGDDSATGGSDIRSCQVELDGSGIWNDMAPIDGAFDEVAEGVEYTMGPLGEGDHFVNVRCIDEYFNVGPERQKNFTVRYYLKEILFITSGATPTAGEQLWLDWIENHSSVEGYLWNYDTVPRADITSGAVNAASYQIVVFADYPNTDPSLDSAMIAYRNTAHYIVMLGQAMKFGVPNLGLATGNSGTHSRAALKVQTEHYITEGYGIYGVYTITNGSWDMYYHPSFEAAKIISMDDSDSRTVVGDAGYVVTYGPIRPDMFNADGDVFATRVIDHALLES